MTGMIFDDGEASRTHPEIAEFLSKASEAVVGQKVVDLRWNQVDKDGKKVAAFRVVMENGQTLILFDPLAYGLGQTRGPVFEG